MTWMSFLRPSVIKQHKPNPGVGVGYILLALVSPIATARKAIATVMISIATII